MDGIKELLPEKEQKLFDDIVGQKVLGASKHIQMIGQMFVGLADQAEKISGSTKTLREELHEVGVFFKRTRGEASQAVSNAVDMMLSQMGDLEEKTLEEAVLKVHQSVEFYALQSERNMEKAIGYAVEIGRNMKKIMVFDYSSTVNAFLVMLGKETAGTEVYIPESRTINGGYAFVPTALKAGMKVHFIPDAAMMYYLKDCDGAFFGAETFYADGTTFNTTGSDLVGLVCKTYQVPLYVLTPMMKLDIRPVYGFRREPVINNLKGRLLLAGFTKEELEQVDFQCPELIPVEPEYIKGVITELGVIPAGAMYPMALDYNKLLSQGKGEDDERVF